MDASKFRHAVHSHMTTGFGRKASGVAHLRGHVRQADYLELVARAAMDGRKFETHLVDDDPVIGSDLYALIKSQAGELFISATYYAPADGLAERAGKELKEILLKQDSDPKSTCRQHNISPELQFQLARAARNCKIQKVLCGFSPNIIESLNFETQLAAEEGPTIEPSPPSIISEKFRMLQHNQAMADDY